LAADNTLVWRRRHFVTFNEERHLEIISLTYLLILLASALIYLLETSPYV